MISKFYATLVAKRAELEKDERGFTLIELLVVVLIIGILAAVAIPVFLSTQTSAQNSTAQSDVANAKVAILSLQAAGDTVAADDDIDELGDFTPSENVTVSVEVGADGFCVEGQYDGNNETFAADGTSGAAEGTCAATGKRAA